MCSIIELGTWVIEGSSATYYTHLDATHALWFLIYTCVNLFTKHSKSVNPAHKTLLIQCYVWNKEAHAKYKSAPEA